MRFNELREALQLRLEHSTPLFVVRPERSPFVNDMSTANQTPAADQADILAANEQLTANLAALQRELADAQSTLDTANTERGQLQTQLTAATDQLAATRADVTRLQAQLAEARQGWNCVGVSWL